MSRLQPDSGQTLISATPTAALPCAEPEKTLTINLADALDSASRDLRKAQAVKRALESALSLLTQLITDNQRLVEQLKIRN